MAEKRINYIDEDEKKLIQTIEETPIENFTAPSTNIKTEAKKAAQEYIRSEQTKMNIRINQSDLEKIKERAAREGLKYQSFIKSVLHKYITGQLVESDKRSG
jgi:predicted DNA binding CopG/RHH family protein